MMVMIICDMFLLFIFCCNLLFNQQFIHVTVVSIFCLQKPLDMVKSGTQIFSKLELWR